jgi:hypothetical protein
MPVDLNIAMDSSSRSYDADGRLHITRSHISKACVNPYYGREIPGSEELGLLPEKIYYLLRAPEELRKAASTFERLPILSKHIPVGTFDTMEEAEKKKFIAGSIGSNVEFVAPYLDADTSIWDAASIAGIETDKIREFSCSYRYVPIMSPGIFDGETYDGIMTQIQGNHLALVESGRAGSDVLAADSKLVRESTMEMTKLGKALKIAFTTAFKGVKVAQDSELEKVLASATSQTLNKAARANVTRLVVAMDASVPAEQVNAVMDALADVDDPKPTKKNDEGEEETANDCAECKAKDGKHAKDCKMGKDSKRAKDAAEEEEDKKKAEDKKAMDEAVKLATDALRADLRAAEEAKRDVRSVVGDVIAQDSAADIYGFALDQMKVDRTGVEGVPALRALFKLAKDRQTDEPAPIAMDSASAQKFPGLKRFRQA